LAPHGSWAKKQQQFSLSLSGNKGIGAEFGTLWVLRLVGRGKSYKSTKKLQHAIFLEIQGFLEIQDTIVV
jgi:hypothetical protein